MERAHCTDLGTKKASFGITGVFKLFQHYFHVSHSYLKSVGILRDNRIPRGSQRELCRQMFQVSEKEKNPPSSSLGVSCELHHLAAVTGN